MPRQPRQVTVLADQLHSAAVHLLRRVRHTDAASGLTGPALSALSVIVHGGPLSLGALARIEQVRPPTVTRQVRALQRAGLVTVRDDPDDGRVRLASATPAGRRVLRIGRARRVAAIATLVGQFTQAQRRSLRRSLHTLEDALRRNRGPDHP